MDSIITTSYAVHFNQRAYDALNAHLTVACYSKIFILVDENTKRDCLGDFKEKVQGDFQFETLEIESGENHKTIATCTRLWSALSDRDADRRSLLINLGGGVITDMGGFVASTFKRGIPFINVPTTLLAMVDASVGGKTGVDLGPLKNQVGVINHPEMVLVVSDFLKTLEERQLQSGFAEMLKHGLIRDAAYWESLKNRSGFANIDRLIYRSVLLKNEVVLQDPTERHLRKILNFGHTLGHAVESFFLENKSRETLLHGEAIAIGMVLEGYLSHQLTGLPESQLTDIKTAFLKRYPKTDFSESDIEAILSLLKFDKKNSHGNINFVLLEHIGTPAIDVEIPPELFQKAFSYYSLS
ncbi:MAG TPA: 3-dehydroquinate synthase [Pricia sp.]|nr:3-dehydroquinate synthase [Pricia sp.]